LGSAEKTRIDLNSNIVLTSFSLLPASGRGASTLSARKQSIFRWKSNKPPWIRARRDYFREESVPDSRHTMIIFLQFEDDEPKKEDEATND
jgi:hypothetical protein